MNQEEIRKNYFSPFQRLIDQSFQSVNFGSDFEAGSGGSAASFRASDPAGYVSNVLAASPVSWSLQNEDEVKAIQVLHNGVEEKNLELPTTGASLYPVGGSDVLGLSSLTQYIADKAINIGVFGLAIVLIIGGFLIIALSNQTVREVVKDATKDAAKAAAA